MSQIIYIKASYHRKPSKAKEVVNSFARNYGKLEQSCILSTETIHLGSDNNPSLVILEAILEYKNSLCVSKLVKSNHLTVLEKKNLSKIFSIEDMSKMCTSLLTSEYLTNFKPDLESALKECVEQSFFEAAAKFMKIIQTMNNLGNQDCLLYHVLIYCRCKSLLETRDIVAIDEGYEMLRQNLDAKFPLIQDLYKRYEVQMRKDDSNNAENLISNQKDLMIWPISELFKTAFPETEPIEAKRILDETIEMENKGRTAHCRYEMCQKVFAEQPCSKQMEWSQKFSENDIDYEGFVRVICEDGCQVDYHPYCWKDRKKMADIKRDIEYLAMVCDTPECGERVHLIERYAKDSKGRQPNTIQRVPRSRHTSKKDDEIHESTEFAVDFAPDTPSLQGDKPKLSVLDVINNQKKKVAEQEATIQSLNEQMERLKDQLLQSHNEVKAEVEMRKNLEEQLNIREKNLQKAERIVLEKKERIKSLENDLRQKDKNHHNDINNKVYEGNQVILALVNTIHEKYLPNDVNFAKFTDSVNRFGARSLEDYKRHLKNAEKPLASKMIIEELQRRYPEENAELLWAEIVANHRGSWNKLTFSQILLETKTLIENSKLDQECPSCMEVMVVVHTCEVCKKQVCLECIKNWNKMHRYDCPMCRSCTAVPDEDFPPLNSSPNRLKPF